MILMMMVCILLKENILELYPYINRIHFLHSHMIIMHFIAPPPTPAREAPGNQS